MLLHQLYHIIELLLLPARIYFVAPSRRYRTIVESMVDIHSCTTTPVNNPDIKASAHPQQVPHPVFTDLRVTRSDGGDDDKYRFGFNGMEKDDEIYGDGNSYTAQFWQYDARLGRRWNVDPIDKPWESSYAAFFNSPIIIVDPLGLDGEMKNGKWTGEAFDKNGNVVDAKGLTNDQMAQKGYSPLIGTGTTDGGSLNTGTIGNKTVTSSTNFWNSDNSVYWSKVINNAGLSNNLLRDRSFSTSGKQNIINSRIYKGTDAAAEMLLEGAMLVAPMPKISLFSKVPWGRVGQYILQHSVEAGIDAGLQYSITGNVDMVGVATSYIPGGNPSKDFTKALILRTGDAVLDGLFDYSLSDGYTGIGKGKSFFHIANDAVWEGACQIKLNNSTSIFQELYFNSTAKTVTKSFNETIKQNHEN